MVLLNENVHYRDNSDGRYRIPHSLKYFRDQYRSHKSVGGGGYHYRPKYQQHNNNNLVHYNPPRFAKFLHHTAGGYSGPPLPPSGPGRHYLPSPPRLENGGFVPSYGMNHIPYGPRPSELVPLVLAHLQQYRSYNDHRRRKKEINAAEASKESENNANESKSSSSGSSGIVDAKELS